MTKDVISLSISVLVPPAVAGYYAVLAVLLLFKIMSFESCFVYNSVILDGALHEVGQDGEEKGKERCKYLNDTVVCPVDHRISVVRFPSSFVHCP